MALQEMFETLAGRLGSSATVRNVYGEPIPVGDRTIIPVAKVGFGFGGGAAPARAGEEQEPHAREGGGGGGAGAKPVGVIEVTPQGTRFIETGSSRKLITIAAVSFAAGILVSWISRR
ncbi:MAG: GerW family sporulation protein [bacterium]|jgi:uncharacterized spore protein YtfJ